MRVMRCASLTTLAATDSSSCWGLAGMARGVNAGMGADHTDCRIAVQPTRAARQRIMPMMGAAVIVFRCRRRRKTLIVPATRPMVCETNGTKKSDAQIRQVVAAGSKVLPCLFRVLAGCGVMWGPASGFACGVLVGGVLCVLLWSASDDPRVDGSSTFCPVGC